MNKILKPQEIIILEDTVRKSTDTKYCFTWSSFKNHVIEEIGELLREEKFVDVTLLCDNHSFRAHRMILCSASPLLKQLLECNPCLDPCISLTDVPWTHMTWILQYIYSGQVAVPEAKFPEFLATAKMLQISTLDTSQATEELNSKRQSETVAEEQQSPTKKMRLSKRIAKRKGKHVEMDTEEGVVDIPIIISTASLDPLETESENSLNQSGNDVFYRTQAVMHEMLKEHTGDQPNQEIITIQTTVVDDMQVEEIVEVVTSMTGDSTAHMETAEGGEVITEITPQSQSGQAELKLLFNPNLNNFRPTHSLAPKTCGLCGKVYSNLSNLRQHVSLVHKPHAVIKCPLCGKEFKSDLYMRRHLICSHNVIPVKKEPHTKDSRRQVCLKADPLKADTDPLQPDELWNEMDAAVESLTEGTESSS